MGDYSIKRAFPNCSFFLSQLFSSFYSSSKIYGYENQHQLHKINFKCDFVYFHNDL